MNGSVRSDVHAPSVSRDCAGTGARVLCLLLFLSLASEALACPKCTWDRVLQSNWHLKFFVINLAAAVAFTANRLDVVRVMYSFIPYVALLLWAHSWFLWHAHPATRPHGVLGVLVTIVVWVLGLNLLGAVWLYAMGHFRFFRRDKEKGLRLWQPLAFAGSVWFANLFMMIADI